MRLEAFAPCSSMPLTDAFRGLTVVETHPESLIDLRVHHPFPELIDYAASFDYSKMDSEQHGHVPAVVILVKALVDWRAAVRQCRGIDIMVTCLLTCFCAARWQGSRHDRREEGVYQLGVAGQARFRGGEL